MKTDEKKQSTVQVTIQGYGGERYMGSVTRKTYDFFKKNEISLEQMANNWTEELWSFIPHEHRLFPPGSPAECSDLGHETGASIDNSNAITIENSDGDLIWKCDLDLKSLKKQGVKVKCEYTVDINSMNEGTIVFCGSQYEKGTFFNCKLDLTEPFDPKKLTISYADLNGWLILWGLEYDRNELDGLDAYDTVGKSSEFEFIIVGDEEVYESRDRDETGKIYSDDDIPDGYQNSPDDWEKSIKTRNRNPKKIGWYDCNYDHGTTFSSLYWNGKEWLSFRNGRPYKECDRVDWWQGYNWDTSDWANRPKAPPDVKCTKCEWIGVVDEMFQNKKYDRFCPVCKTQSSNMDWLIYDPDTKIGKENRKKYCH